MVSKFISFLEKNNITYNTISNDLLSFTYKDLNYLFFNDPVDMNYIRIILPEIAKIETAEEKDESCKKINFLNRDMKVVKGSLWEVDEKSPNKMNVWLSFEQLIYSYENINEIFTRGIEILQSYCNRYRTEVLK